MRNTFALIIALLAVLASSCSQDELLEKRRMSYIDDTEFFASFDTDSILSRTYIEEDAETSKLYLRWTKADEITIFRGNTLNQRYQYKGETGDNSAGFRQIASDDFVSYNDLDNPTNYAVYPYNENTRITEKGVLNIALPANQKYAEKSFGLGANTMVAVTQHTGDVNLLFKNVCGYFKFKFYGEDLTIRSVTLQGNNEENLAGNANVTSGYGSLPTMTMVSDTTKTLTLDCGEAGIKVGATKETATEFWFVVPPTQFTKGFTITVTDTDGGKFIKTTEKVFEIKRNIVKPISAIEVETVPDYSAMNIPDNEIWYVTNDGNPVKLDNAQTLAGYSEPDFGAKVTSNTYYDGKGIIKFDGVVSKIGKYAFFENSNLEAVYIPHKTATIEKYAFQYCENLTHVYSSNNLSSIEIYAFEGCNNLSEFHGSNVSDDGNCIIIDNVLYAFAHKGVKNYVFPNGIKRINQGACRISADLESITFNEGLESIDAQSFEGCERLKTINLSKSLKNIDSYAFKDCYSLEGFYGNEAFHTDDNKCLLSYSNQSHPGPWLIRFAGVGMTEYVIPEKVKAIENYAFSNLQELTTVTLPASIGVVGSSAFSNCNNLEKVYGPNTSEDHRAFVYKNEYSVLIARKNLPSTYHIPNNITKIGYGAFSGCNDIEIITMGDQITHVDGYAFSNMANLKSITLSASLQQIGLNSNSYNIFHNSTALEAVYFRSLTPPSYLYPENIDNSIADYPKLTVYVPKGTLDKYINSDWSPFNKYMKEYEYTDLPFEYISTDYSEDGKVTTLQTAFEGNGIDVILMGDAYSDREISNGTYKDDMKRLYDNLFTQEPYNSYQNLFNVYYVNVVSATEGYKYGNTALKGYFGDGTLVGGNDAICFTYAQKAIEKNRMDKALIIVAMNSNNYAGTCYMYSPENGNEYGDGISVAYFPKGGNTTTFAQLLHHEALGHGFAKLADEYAYEDMGLVSSDYISQIKGEQISWGWWKNVDFTNNLNEIRWSHFINDTRYANDGLGAYEGGLTYWTGVWRPTENSIMRYNTGGFNAPSREAIYYRIHKLAYGDSWQYDYEEFVKYDAINRKAATSSYNPYRQTNYKPLHAPVVIRKSWKDAQ